MTDREFIESVKYLICKSVGATDLKFVDRKPDNGIPVVVRDIVLYIVVEYSERSEDSVTAIKKEIEYLTGFKESVMKKLSNDGFINNAKPEIIYRERIKFADIEKKLKSLHDIMAVS